MKKCLFAGGAITVVLLVVFASFSSVSSYEINSALSTMIDTSEEYYFKNVSVIIFGRCRTVFVDDAWADSLPLYIGTLAVANPLTEGDLFEFLYVIIYNSSILKPWKIFRLKGVCSAGVTNATGFFFYAIFQQSNIRLIPPAILIKCYAEGVYVST